MTLQHFPVLCSCFYFTSFHFLIIHTTGNHPSPFTRQLQNLFLATFTFLQEFSLVSPAFLFYFPICFWILILFFSFHSTVQVFIIILKDVDDSSTPLLIYTVLNYSQMHCFLSNQCSFCCIAKTKYLLFESSFCARQFF